MRGIMLSKTEDKHFHLPETEPEAGALTVRLEPSQGSSSLPHQLALMQEGSSAAEPQRGGSPGSEDTAGRLLKPCVCQVIW